MRSKLLKHAMRLALPMAVAVSVQAGSVHAGDPLQVKIDGVRNDSGVVHVLLFDNARAFDKNLYAKMFRYAKLDAQSGELSAEIEDVPGGKYAIMIHHDENDNGQFEMQGTLPLEGFAYSNNVGTEGVPKFDEAAFEYTGSEPVEIRMNYVE